jgi:glycosyltransferase involved in cell wall biosynthesis
MRKILIFSLAYFPQVGGAEIAIKEITDRILSEDIEFHLITLRFSPEDAREERIGNVTVHRVGWGGSYLAKIFFVPHAALAARALHREHRFDMMWAMMSYMLFPLVLSRIKRPYLLTLQEGDPFEHMFKRWFIVPFRPILSYGFRHAACVQTISTYLSSWALRLGAPEEKVVRVPNGVTFPTGGPLSRHTRERRILVTTSRLVKKNGLDDVIRALVLLPESVRFRVYGIGSEEGSLKRLARELGVAERIEWKGYIDHKELYSALSECDIFVRPSLSEGMGNSFIEAMAAGLPVIATQEGGIADFLFDAKRNPGQSTTGWAVDVHSPQQIADAVKEIMISPQKVEEVCANARALVKGQYEWDSIAGNMQKLLAGVMHEKLRKERIKIVVATPLYPPEIGGPATYAKLLEEGLPKSGIDVELVKFSEVRHLPRIIRHVAYYLRVLKAARSADAVLALDPVSVGLPAYLAAWELTKPFFVKIVGDYAWEQGQQRFGIKETLDEFVKRGEVPFVVEVFRRIQTRVAQGATRVIVPSQYLKGIITAWGVKPEQVEVIYNAVPLEEVGKVSEHVAALPRPLVVSAGRLVPWKHMDEVIDAVVDIPEASLAIVGDGPDRAVLERHAREMIPGRFFFTGALSHKDALATMLAADVFVLNSSYEGLSHFLIEAQVLGVPTVATRVGGNPEVITHDQSGILINSRDRRELTAALRTLLPDEALRARLSEGAKRSAQRFSTETMLTHVCDLLQTLI